MTFATAALPSPSCNNARAHALMRFEFVWTGLRRKRRRDKADGPIVRCADHRGASRTGKGREQEFRFFRPSAHPVVQRQSAAPSCTRLGALDIGDLTMEAASARPWTAVIASPFDGAKSKYNIAAAAEVTPAAPIAKAPSVKQRKEQCACSRSEQRPLFLH